MSIKLWQLYFGVLLAFSAPIYLLQSYSRQWEIFDALFFLVSTVGLFGQIWGRHLIGRRFWQSFVPVFVVWNIFYNYIIPPSAHNVLYFTVKLNWTQATVSMVHMFLLLPALHALWIYAYESAGFWNPYIYSKSSYKEREATSDDIPAPREARLS